MSPSNSTRRQFIKRSLTAAGVGAGFAIGGTKSTGRVIGASETVRIAVAGLNGRGGSHVAEFLKMSDVAITHLVDPDTRTFEKRLEQVKEQGGRTPRTVQDIRRVLDDHSVDAVSIATPNHWHALMTIWACQAGKDVYVEKPCSHNIHEGRIAVEAARRHGRIVQHGTQGRSSREWALIAAAVQSGKLGRLLVSRGLCYKPRGSIGVKSTVPPPPQLEFDIWLGPAPRQPYHGNLVHYNWHWFWDFGNGDIGNQGVHQMDIARWLMSASRTGGATFPKTVISIGGRFGYRDQGETPNTQISIMDFGDAHLVFEVRGLQTPGFDGQKIGNIAYLDEGVITQKRMGRRNEAVFFPKGKSEPIPLADLVKLYGIPDPAEVHRGPGAGHFGNFLAAMRSRRMYDLNADILEGHYSAALCHLANVSYRLGEDVPYRKAESAFGADKEARETLARMEAHLKEAAVPLDGLKHRLGRTLTFDAQTESFVGDAEANRLLTRAYRAPFVVPDRLA
jgi:predicted dehydrogenase